MLSFPRDDSVAIALAGVACLALLVYHSGGGVSRNRKRRSITMRLGITRMLK